MDDATTNAVRRFLAEEPAAPAPEAPLGELALQRGYLRRDQLEECLAEQALARAADQPVQLGQIFLRRKLISNEELLGLINQQKEPLQACPACGWVCDASSQPEEVRLRCLACGETLRDAGDRSDVRPPAVPAEERRIGKYRIVRELGRGGMGIVYEAEDPTLQRRVALKVLKEGEADDSAVERLHREAAIAAQLRHPHVIGIHEVGTFRPRGAAPVHFIAMDYVEGRTFAQILKAGKTRQGDLLRILEVVARAVAYAHSKGIIHRDLKPTNVLVDRGGRVVLTDFGIARSEAFQTRLTQTDMLVGTPLSMAPEQIVGAPQDVDARTDVYALGVMLYQILAGRPPFKEESQARLFHRILTAEPARPPGAPADLEVVCLKALEKEKDRRYASAAEFAEELARFRRGQPILARPSTPLSRFTRRLARRKGALATALGGSLLVGAILLAFGAWARRERAEAVRQLGERLDTALRATLKLRRAGDLEGMRAFAREAEDACREAARKFPNLPHPHAHLARMHRAQMDYEKALGEANLALGIDPLHAPALYERVVLTAGLYRARVDALVQRAWRSQGERLIHERAGHVKPADVVIPTREALARRDAAASEHRKGLEADLAALEEVGGVAAAELSCAKGLAAWLRGNAPAARRLLERAPLLEEAVEARATLELDERRFEEAVRAWTAGAEADKGYLPHLEGRGQARLAWGWSLRGRGEDALPHYQAAAADFKGALAKEPRRLGAQRNLGVAHFFRGVHLDGARSGDSVPAYQQAVEELTRAIEIDPSAAEAWMWRGLVRGVQSMARLFRAGDAADLAQDAIRDLTESIRLDPAGDEAYLWRALARVPLAVLREMARGDTEALYRDSLVDFAHALRLNPGRGETWMWRGVLHGVWGWRCDTRGEPTGPVFAKALADLDVAVAKVEGSEALEWRGRVRLLMADAAAAREDFTQALARNPKSLVALVGRGEARMQRGDFAPALADLDEALKVDPAAPYVHLRRGETLLRRGEARGAEEDLRGALAEFKTVLETQPLNLEVWAFQARARKALRN